MAQAQPSFAVYQPRIGPADAPEGFVGFQLARADALPDTERVRSQLRLVLQFLGLIPDLFEAAIEIRLVARPYGWRGVGAGSVKCYVLARLLDRHGNRASVRAAAKTLGLELFKVLNIEMPAYSFRPLSSGREVSGALRPFSLRYTQEVRRHLIPKHGIMLPSPLIGMPDMDVLVRYMLMRLSPTVLSIRIEPSAPHSGVLPHLAWADDARQQLNQAYRAAKAAHERGMESDGVAHAQPTLAQVHLLRQWVDARLNELGRLAYHMRIQVASPTPIGRALSSALCGEVSGFGRMSLGKTSNDVMDSAAWRADVVVPRNRRMAGSESGRSELALAIENLERMRFNPWGDPLRYPTIVPNLDLSALITLADIDETTQLFALPPRAHWLLDDGEGEAMDAAKQLLRFVFTEVTKRPPADD